MDDNRLRSHSVMQVRTTGTGIQVRGARFLKIIANLRMRRSRTAGDDKTLVVQHDSQCIRHSRSMDTTGHKTCPTQSTSTLNIAPDNQMDRCSKSLSRDSGQTSKRLSARELGEAGMHSASPMISSDWQPISSQTGQGAIPTRSQTDVSRADRPELGISSHPMSVDVRLSLSDHRDTFSVPKPQTRPTRNTRERRSDDLVSQPRSTKGASSATPSQTNKSRLKVSKQRASTATTKRPSTPTTATPSPATTIRPPMQPSTSTTTPPSLNRSRSSRLSPSLVIRQLPMPIQHLPTLPPLTPLTPLTRTPSYVRLRSVPALPVEGPGDDEDEADHENMLMLSDSDDEDIEDPDAETPAGAVDDDVPPSEGSSSTHLMSRSSYSVGGPPVLPAVETSRFGFDFSFLDDAFDFGSDVRRGRLTADEVSLSSTVNRRQSPRHSPTRTIRPNDVDRNRNSIQFRSPDLLVTRPGISHTPSRASMYRLPSKSMVTLSPVRESSSASGHETIAHILDKGKARESSEVASTLAPKLREPSINAVETPTASSPPPLRRQRSMPTFNPSSEPPPYPSFAQYHSLKQPMIVLRDEEGREKLPPYSNSIYLTAIMPRKMEFTAPGVQAKDRKWRRVLCVLQGTAFKVYQCSRSVTGAGLLEDWWEKRVGVGDVAIPNSAPPASVENGSSRSAKTDLTANPNSVWPPRSSEPGSNGSYWNLRGSSSDLLQPSSHHHRSLTPDVGSAGLALSGPLPKSTSQLTTSSYSQTTDPPKLKPSKNSLLRTYTMQHAESGLGNDYAKRKNVIRLRLEGEQFLLQAVDVTSVVEWIEAFQAATNVALDLDERPMPKGPLFPRRRRRRRGDGGGATGPRIPGDAHAVGSG